MPEDKIPLPSHFHHPPGLLQYKIACMRWGVSCPILDLVVFRTIRQSVGGQVRLMLVGGAPLATDTKDFVRACFSISSFYMGHGLGDLRGRSTTAYR